MILKYSDPEKAKDDAYHYYQLCIDRFKRTNHHKDQIELVRARKEFQRLSQYARLHKGNLSGVSDGANVTKDYYEKELTKQRERNAHLVRAINSACQQLSLPVDQQDQEVIRNLKKLTRYSESKVKPPCAPPDQ